MLAQVKARLGQLRLSYRPVAAMVVLLLPMGFLTWGYAGLQRGQVAFANRERDGVAQLQPLWTLLAETVEARRRLATDTPRDDAAVQEAIAGVARVERRFAAELPMPSMWSAVREQLQQVQHLTDPTQAAAQYERATGGLLRVIIEVADQSNLILDPALDSYYVMDALVVQLPLLMDRSASAMTEQKRVRTGSDVEAHTAWLALAADTAELRRAQDAVTAAMTKSTSATRREALRDLRPVIEAQRNTMQAVIQQLDPAAPTVASSAAFAAAIRSQRELAERLLPQLRALLSTRIRHLWTSAYTINAATLGALGLLAYLLVGVYRSAGERRRAQRHAALVRHAVTIANSADTIAAGAQDVLREVCTTLGCIATQLWTTAPQATSWYVAEHEHSHQHHQPGNPCGLQTLAAAGSAPDAQQLPLDARTRIATGAHELPEIRPIAEACGIGTAIAVPVLTDSEAAGMLALYLPATAPAPSDELISALEQIGVALGRVVERQRTAATLVSQATHDAVTGLVNRWGLLEAFNDPLPGCPSPTAAAHSAVLLLNLDRFRLINDALGYAVGDAALREVAVRLRRTADPMDVVARLSADEFVVLARRHSAPNGPGIVFTDLAEHLRQQVCGPLTVEGHHLTLNASVGVRPVTEDDATVNDPAVILRDADTALREAKRTGKNQVRVFDAALRRSAETRLADETALARAISAGQLLLHHQPIVALSTGQPVGTEALVRWHRPGHGLVPPDRFITLAEDSGLIVDLGRWVLRQACRDAATWPDAIPGLGDGSVSVNVSTRQLTHPRFLTDLDEALRDAALPAHRLIVEITESALIDDTATVIETLHAIRRRGVEVALDDFGTGYSSLSYLQKLPISIVKIDKSFVDPITSRHDGTAFTEAVITLAQASGLRTVAEGIEHPAQADALRQLGCHRGQGYRWSRPVPLEHLAAVTDAIIRHHPAPSPAALSAQ